MNVAVTANTEQTEFSLLSQVESNCHIAVRECESMTIPRCKQLGGGNMQLLELAQNSPTQSHRQNRFARKFIVAGWIGACLGQVGVTTQSHAQGSNSQLLPPSREELADEERQTWSLKKFPSQPY